MRYFFISYIGVRKSFFSNGTHVGYLTMMSEDFPKISEISEHLKNKDNFYRIGIQSIYEFKTKEDFENFRS